MIGGIRKKSDFARKNAPIKTNSNPRYIGFRVTRNGPPSTSSVGSSPGRTEVPALRKAEKPEKPAIKPISRKNMPMALPAGIGSGAKGMSAIKTAPTIRRSSARMGGGINGGLVRTSREKSDEFEDSRNSQMILGSDELVQVGIDAHLTRNQVYGHQYDSQYCLRRGKKIVPEGPDESSPAIYCWVRIQKIRPSR
jgi:hypothetical protein